MQDCKVTVRDHQSTPRRRAGPIPTAKVSQQLSWLTDEDPRPARPLPK